MVFMFYACIPRPEDTYGEYGKGGEWQLMLGGEKYIARYIQIYPVKIGACKTCIPEVIHSKLRAW